MTATESSLPVSVPMMSFQICFTPFIVLVEEIKAPIRSMNRITADCADFIAFEQKTFKIIDQKRFMSEYEALKRKSE